VNSAYVGKATFAEYVPLTLEQVSIPLADVAQFSVSRYNSSGTATFVGVGLTIVTVVAVTAAIVADNIRTGLLH
jgi:hypothetical protein